MKKFIFLFSCLVLFFIPACKKNISLQPKTVEEKLYKATSIGDYKWTKRLVEKYNADINWKNSVGKTPLIKTCERGHPRVAQYLLLKKNKAGKRYVNYNAVDNKCETALHKAARKGKFLIVKMLLQAGADRTIQNEDCLTALDMAKDKHQKAVIKLFKQKIKTIDQIETLRQAQDDRDKKAKKAKEAKKKAEKAKKKAQDKKKKKQEKSKPKAKKSKTKPQEKKQEKEKPIKKRFKKLRGKVAKLPPKKKKKK